MKAKKPTKKSGMPKQSLQKVELNPVADRPGVYTARIAGKLRVVCYTARDRVRAERQYAGVTIPHARLKAAQAESSKGLPLYIAVSIEIKGKFAHGWMVPAALFAKHQSSDTDFNLSAAARNAYMKAGGAGFVFVLAPMPKGKVA